jgi:hypothetical protein
MAKRAWSGERWALVAAVGVHALFLVVAERLPPRIDVAWSARSEAASEADFVPVEVLSELDALRTQPDRAPSSAEGSVVERGGSTGAPARAPGAEIDPETGTEGTAPPGNEAPGNEAPGRDGDLPPPGSPDEYGDAAEPGDAPPTFGMPGMIGLLSELQGPAAPTRTKRAAPVPEDAAERAIASTMRTKDKRLGLTIPAAGLVQNAVSTAMRGVPVPHNTRATIRVELSPDGKVASTRVVSASGGDAAAWERMARSVAQSLGKQKLAMGPNGSRSGAIITVTATQKHVFPTGTTKAADVKPVCANAVLNEIIAANDKDLDAPSAEGKVPVFLDENGLPCIPVGFGGISDVSNIGAQKQIQVQTSVNVTLPGEVDLPDAIRTVDTAWVPKAGDAPRPSLPAKIRKRQRDKEKKK